MKPAVILTVLLLAACDRKTPAAPEHQQAAQAKLNTMSCLAGDVKLSGAGEPEVGIGGFGIHGDTLNGFALGLSVEQGGKVHQVSSSIIPLPMQAGTYHFPSLTTPGASFGFYNLRNKDGDLLRGYNGGTYGQQYSTIENDPEAKLKVQVSKMLVSDSPQPGFKRVHAVGEFEFNAAALPAASPSDDCTRNAVARSLESVKAGKQILPLYDAAVCGAEKKHVRCEFDIVADFAKTD